MLPFLGSQGPTAAELRDQAVAALKQTTIPYSEWERRVAAGTYTPKDGSATNWGKALAALEQIGAAAPPPPPPPPSGIPRYGISTGAGPSTAVLDQVAAIGAQYVRFDYNGTGQNSLVDYAHGKGLATLLILPRQNPAGMGATVANYWKTRLPLRMYELGNEPDLNGWTAATYAPMAKQWCDEIRAADPAAVIWLPGGFKGGDQAGKTPPDFAKAVCAAGCSFDVWSGHYFDDDPAWNDPRNGWHYAAAVRAILDANGRQNVKIASSESHAFYREGTLGQANKVNTYLSYAKAGTLASVAIYRMNYSETGYGDSSLLDAAGAKRPAWTSFHDFVAAS